MTEFAILAPVPLEHLESGEVIAAEKGFVAFGSRKFELFRDIDQRRDGNPVPVLIYPSHEDDQAKVTSMVSWIGWYIGSEETHNGRHSLGMDHRPPTTGQYAADNKGHWAVFWHVRQLLPLSAKDRFAISKLQTTKGGWRKNAPPRGPELVAVPTFIEFPE